MKQYDRPKWNLPTLAPDDPILRVLESDGFMRNAKIHELSLLLTIAADVRAMKNPQALEKIHRVQFTKTKIFVLSLGLTLDSQEGVYEDASKLPDWIQDRIAVLSMMSTEPPTKFVEGVGRRIDEHVFWVVEP